jgi:predicted MFS family arabinose efflux permease
MNIWSSLRGLPRDMWILAIASLINRAGTMVLPFLVLYLTRELGFAPARAGFALAVFGAGAIIAAPIAGTLSDRIGPLPIMRWSLILTGILLLIYPYVRGFAAVLAMTVVWAVITEAFRPASLALIADIVTPEQRKPAYALIRLAINIGMSIGPAAAGFIAAKSFGTIFIVDGITTIAAGIVLLLAPIRHVRHHVPERDSSIRASIGRLLVRDDPRLLIFLTAVFLTGVVFFQHEGALALFLVDDLGLSPTSSGFCSRSTR